MKTARTEIDVAVIGAGPAGSVAALALARAGRRVIVIERETMPRPKVCGGCLSGTAIGCLRSLFAHERWIPGAPAKAVTFVMGRYRLTYRTAGRTWIVDRADFDASLARAAAAAGAQVRCSALATLEGCENGWRVRVGEEYLDSRHVIVATGLGGLAKRLGIAGHGMNRRLIAQQWVQPSSGSLPRPGEVEMHWLRGGYVGLAAHREGSCTVALAADAGNGDGEPAFRRLRRLNPDAPIWTALPSDAPRLFGSKGTSGFPWQPKRLGDRNVLLVGDAAGYEEPYSGEGIGLAMRSAMFAADAILKEGDVERRYTSLMRRYHQPVMRRTRLLGRALRSGFMHGLASHKPLLPKRLLTHLIERVHVRRAI